MCPSWRVTHEEEHSTRGRAHLLWEMTQNPDRSDAVIRGGWRSEEVKKSLDLCLACKGCKSDCPVNVDVATYKAEFLSHYYEGRLRPLNAYALVCRFLGKLGIESSGLGEPDHATSVLEPHCKTSRRHPREAPHPSLRLRNFQRLVLPHQ